MLQWFMEHGGDVDIKDGDGLSPMYVVDMVERLAPNLAHVLITAHGNGQE